MSDSNPRPPVGYDLLRQADLNKTTAFSDEERERLRLRGLLPPQVDTLDVQIQRVLGNLRRKDNDIEKYIFLSSLLGRNQRLFFRVVIDHFEEMLPLIYTPTVGQACKEFAHIFREPKGFYVTPQDRGRIRRILDNWPESDVRVVVVTDGERILGLGDLGANGMGIPVGKLALYTACAGIHPRYCLPVMFDVGTNNEELLGDPLYLGLRDRRVTGAGYDDLFDEFVEAIQDAFPDALIQFEDFLTPNAYALLKRYRDKILCFNDDIQGTASVALAGIYASTRISGTPFEDLRILYLGAGSAATGIADLTTLAFRERGLSEAEARGRQWFVNSRGLVVKSRTDLREHNLPYAHDREATDFIGAIRALKPHVLIGATGRNGAFTEQALRLMAELHDRPVVFALSNPTERAECTAEEAYEWTAGKVLFASGSPFPPVRYGGKTFRVGQGNNVYVFPGVGLGAHVCRATRITEEMFLVAAHTIADQVSKEDLDAGALYSPIAHIRDLSRSVAAAVARQAYEQGLAREPQPPDLEQAIANEMYDPRY